MGTLQVYRGLIMFAGLLLAGVSAPSVLADSNNDAVALIDGPSFGSAAAHISTIESGAFGGARGVVSVNLAAGDGNVQQNSGTFASSNGYSQALIRAGQTSAVSSGDFYQILSARIEAGAFDGIQGIAMVNQSSGVGNVQFNGAAIAIGGLGSTAVIQLNNEALGAQAAATNTNGGNSSSGPYPGYSAETSLDPDAFKNARGVILINQAAGRNNATANSFTLSITP